MAVPNPQDVRIRTQAGGTLTNANINSWLNPNIMNPIEDATVVDVYVDQVCYYVNQVRGLLDNGTPGNRLRAMLSMPQSFYTALIPAGGEATGSQMLRAADISRTEFAQLEHFFIPINMNEHSSLIIVSPLDYTIELADANKRSDRAMSRIFSAVLRFLIHELRGLPGGHHEHWRFLWGQTPIQDSKADCANYTCLFAKRLALQWPLTRDTDIGQGPNREFESKLKTLVIRDLASEWTKDAFPFGRQDPTNRHYGRDSASVKQQRLFWDPAPDPERVAMHLRTLRSRTSRLDRLTGSQLHQWCQRQSPIYYEDGSSIPSMAGYEKPAMLSKEDFVAWIEERQVDILNRMWP